MVLNMFRIDDPLLSLILRFVLSNDELKKPDEEFIQRQIRTLMDYVAQFPEEDQEKNAFVWIEQHAEKYRRNWERQTVSAYVSTAQWVDCPMIAKGDANNYCMIHQEWLQLLEAYRHNLTSTRSYVKNALALLQEHKDQLKVNMQQVKKTKSCARRIPNSNVIHQT